MSTETEAAAIRVIVADDDSIVRGALTSMIDDVDDVRLVAAVGTGREAVELVRQNQGVDVVLMDLRMPQQNGLAATAEISSVSPGVAVVLLTSLDDRGLLRDALTAGARGLLVKSSGTAAILSAIRAASQGNVVISPEPVTRTEGLRRKGAPSDLRISSRERDVLGLLCRAYSNAEIARELNLSESRVKAHVSGLIDHFQVDSRLKVVVRAFEWNLIARP